MWCMEAYISGEINMKNDKCKFKTEVSLEMRKRGMRKDKQNIFSVYFSC